MKKMKLYTVCASLFIGSAFTAFAAIEAATVGLVSGTIYTVPAGKVFAVYHVIRSSVDTTLQIKATNSTFQDMGLDTITTTGSVSAVTAELSKRYYPAMYLQAGSEIRAQGGVVTLSGLLVDPSDLFLAGSPSVYENEIFSVAQMNGDVKGSVRFPTAQRVVFDIEKSTDLETWVKSVDAVITSTGGTDYDFKVVSPSETLEFYRTNVDPNRNR